MVQVVWNQLQFRMVKVLHAWKKAFALSFKSNGFLEHTTAVFKMADTLKIIIAFSKHFFFIFLSTISHDTLFYTKKWFFPFFFYCFHLSWFRAINEYFLRNQLIFLFKRLVHVEYLNHCMHACMLVCVLNHSGVISAKALLMLILLLTLTFNKTMDNIVTYILAGKICLWRWTNLFWLI